MCIASSYRQWCNVDTESALNVRKYVRKVRIDSEREQSEPRLTVSLSSSLTIGEMRSIARFACLLACLLACSLHPLARLLACILACWLTSTCGYPDASGRAGRTRRYCNTETTRGYAVASHRRAARCVKNQINRHSGTMSHVSAINLKRTDTTLDLSQKAEKR